MEKTLLDGDSRTARHERLEHLIEHAGHLLPEQGPITVFIHHNTLHAFESLTFEEGVRQGAKRFDCEPFLPEDRYRQELSHGRIRDEDLVAVLQESLSRDGGTPIVGLDSRLELRLGMLRHPICQATASELLWFVAETDALTKMRADVPAEFRARLLGETRHWAMRDLARGADDSQVAEDKSRSGITSHVEGTLRGLRQRVARQGRISMEHWNDATWERFCLQSLFYLCQRGIECVSPSVGDATEPVRHRDLLLAATGQDSDALVHEVLIRLCAAFLDQGLTHWMLPRRDEGLYRAFCSLYRAPLGPPQRWLRGLAAEAARLQDQQIEPVDSILESLEALGVPEAEWEDYLSATLLALRGFAGMIRQAETRTDRLVRPVPAGSLLEYLAVRLILERFALAHVARAGLGYVGELKHLRATAAASAPEKKPPSVEQRAFVVFQLALVRGWTPELLLRLSPDQWTSLLAEIDAFPEIERRCVFHLAYERRYRHETLNAIAARQKLPDRKPVHPRFQVVCCIDEREESFRRHIEEVAPEAETFGFAGFFGVAMYYRGATDAHYVPLCPIIMQPSHWVAEEVAQPLQAKHGQIAKRRRALGTTAHLFHLGSRSFTLGALLASVFGALASLPLIFRVLFPRAAAILRRRASRFVQAPEGTALSLERKATKPSREPDGLGLSVDEMAAIVERLLRDLGMTRNFARLVFIVGHGSSSVNNPHVSAYHCGACGGAKGGPNARAFATIANDPRVRGLLAARGILVPSETVFIGGYHNTCDDGLDLYDLDHVPESHRGDLAYAQKSFQNARQRDAHERCRRFESAPLNMSAETALRHVEGRAEDLAQVRPEYCHASNALCIVGRRSKTRGLYLDRRAFLVSYDPAQDDEQFTLLTRIMQPIVPVCGGISLEYYFSYTDSTGYGCGTKLPHNVTSLLGVMDGAASDLRTGLSAQMVEIHEPMRLLVLIEATPATLLRLMELNPAIGKPCQHGWVQIVSVDPQTGEMHELRGDKFVPYQPEPVELPRVESSADWYRGWRGNLEYALVDGAR